MTSLNNMLMALRIFPNTPTSITVQKNPLNVDQLPEITLNEVADHDDHCDCWIVLYDRVYDVTKFLNTHPGGADLMLDHAGRDATLAFHGTGHSKDAINMLRNYLIGELPINQRIFRKENKNSAVLLSGIPD